MSSEPPLLLALDLTGTFAFALNGALIALRLARLDIVGVVTLAMITALGGGIIRDVLIDSLPPATFSDWRYLAVAAGGGLVTFLLGRRLFRLTLPITVLDAAGLSLFAVTGVGGGTLRDVLIRQVPSVLSSGLYAIPALIGATITVVALRLGSYGIAVAIAAAAVCFLIRMVGVHFGLNAPTPRAAPDPGP